VDDSRDSLTLLLRLGGLVSLTHSHNIRAALKVGLIKKQRDCTGAHAAFVSNYPRRYHVHFRKSHFLEMV
jgi:hypothetical protein